MVTSCKARGHLLVDVRAGVRLCARRRQAFGALLCGIKYRTGVFLNQPENSTVTLSNTSEWMCDKRVIRHEWNRVLDDFLQIGKQYMT